MRHANFSLADRLSSGSAAQRSGETLRSIAAARTRTRYNCIAGATATAVGSWALVAGEMTMGSLKHELEVLSQVITWLVGPVSIAVAVATYVRQWPTSYRRATGWTLAMFGALLVASSSCWIVVEHLWTSTGRVVALGAVGIAGLGFTVTGLVRVARAPVDSDVETLRAIASAVESQLDRLSEQDRFDDNYFIRLGTRRPSGWRGRRISVRRSLPRARSQLMGIVGESGAGKSVSLRHLAMEICRDVKRRRHPELMALYVDLADFPGSPDAVTVDQVYSYIKDTIAAGNTNLADHLARHVREPRDRPGWVILFDSFDVLLQSIAPDLRYDAARRYLDAFRQFLNSTGPNFRGIIACREPRFLEPIGSSVLTLDPLSWHQIAEFCRRIGLDPVMRQKLFKQLRNNVDLVQISRNPLLLRFLCDHLLQAPASEVPATLHEIVGYGATALIEATRKSASTIDEITRAAEDIACYLISEAASNEKHNHDAIVALLRTSSGVVNNPEAVVEDLIAAGIVRSDGAQALGFAHSCYQDYFATCWILRSWQNYELRLLATNPLWHVAAATALQIGETRLQEELIDSFAEVFIGEAENEPGVVSAIDQFTAIDPGDPLPPMPSVSFTWPKTSLRILNILAIGLEFDPERLPLEMRKNVDRMMVSAFAAGLLHDQQQAVEVSFMSTPDVALGTVERALASDSMSLRKVAVQPLIESTRLFARLKPKARAIAIMHAATDAVSIDRAFAKPGGEVAYGGTLIDLLRYLLTVTQLTAWVLALYSAKGLISDLATIPKWSKSYQPPGVILWPWVLVAAILFLVCWTGRRRGSDSAILTGAFLVMMAAIGSVIGVMKIIASITFIAVGSFHPALVDAIAAYALTWPISMIVRILLVPSPVPRDWILPQVAVVRLVIAEASFEFRDHTKGLNRNVFRNKWKTGSPELILESLDGARTNSEAAQALRRMTASQAGLSAETVHVLRDLARALEWVNQIVPSRTTTTIPPGVWDLGPKFSTPKFNEWLRQFDRHHSGRLSWLAANHRGDIARLLRRADSQNV